MNSIEGYRGIPRNKPPFPAIEGLFQSPTIINNVETLSAIPWIILNGGEAYKKIGTPKSTGTRLTSISGHVNNPGVFEVPMGYPLENLINEECKGVLGGKKIKGVIPGGTSTPILTPEEIKGLTMDYESLEAKGSMLGSGATIVIAEGTCMVKALRNMCEFYHHESCGQCTPCREGLGWITKMVERIENGEGRTEDLDEILELSSNILGNTVCPLADGAVMPIQSVINKYRSEFEEHIRNKKCPFNGNMVVS
jgi:NADH-quinone oxidoreductase subunit F